MCIKSIENIKNEIKVLEIALNHSQFEQNHIFNDWMTRITLIVTMGLTISIVLLNYGYIFYSSILFIVTFLDLIRYNWQLNKKRDNISKRSMNIRTEIMNKYESLGIRAFDLTNSFNIPV